MEEHWKSLDPFGFFGYDVSNLGRIRSYHIKAPPAGRLAEKPLRILVASASSGYRGVHLYDKNGKRIFKGLHTLVALAFLGDKPEGAFVLHKDGNPLNNNIGNLYYGNAVDNSRDARQHGTLAQGERSGVSKISRADAIKIRELYAARKMNQTDLAKKFGIGQTQVSNIVTGKLWKNAPGPIIKRVMIQDEKGQIKWI